jgi:hypothetical protein
MKNICIALALILVAPASRASPLEGHYQVTSLVIAYNGGPPRGFNNTGLYVAATDRRVRVVGAWRGVQIKRDAVVERAIGDTLVLRDAANAASVFKFHIRDNVITGRHSLNYEDGVKQIYDTKATVRRMNLDEVNRLRAFLDF